MFRLHERTRLFLCRTGFLLLCLTPTLFLGGAAVHYRSSSYLEARREEWTAVLSDKLGLDVRVARLSYPLWNTALLENVVLADPETGEEVLRARYIEVALEEGRWVVTAGQPEVKAESLWLLADLFHNRLLRGHALQLVPVEFEARELTFRSAYAAQTFEQVHAELLTTETGKRAGATFHIAGLRSETPLEVIIERRRGSEVAKTTCKFDTHGTAVPTVALVPVLPWLKPLGGDTTFQGAANFEQAKDAPATTEIRGKFRDVDLGSVMAASFPHHELSGWAEVEFERLKLSGFKIIELCGRAQTGRRGGTIGRPLLAGLQNQLDLAPAKQPQLRNEPLVRYSHLAFGFRLDREGLRLSGDDDQAGLIMASASAGVLLQGQSIRPVTHLIDVLSPRSEAQIPATSEARSLLEILPLPPPAAGPGFRVPLRLRTQD